MYTKMDIYYISNVIVTYNNLDRTVDLEFICFVSSSTIMRYVLL